MPRSPLPVLPLDDAARCGKYRVVTNGEHFAIARFRDDAWEFASGSPLDFVPVGYYAPTGGEPAHG